MKKIFLVAAAAIVMISCGDNSQTDTANSSDSTTAGQAPTTPSLSDSGIGTNNSTDTSGASLGSDTRSGIGTTDPTLSTQSKTDTSKR